MLAAGLAWTAIRDKLVSDHGVSRRTAERYLADVRQALVRVDPPPVVVAAPAVVDVPNTRAFLREKLTELYEAALADSEYGPAARALDQLAKLDGLYAPTQVAVEGRVAHAHVVDPRSLSPAERRRELEELRARRETLMLRARNSDLDADSENEHNGVQDDEPEPQQ